MARPTHTDRPKEVSVQIPQSLLSRVDLLLYEPAIGRKPYAARSTLIATLLYGWVEAHPKAQKASSP